jgi:hypothetical protein
MTASIGLDRFLECAVSSGWPELMPAGMPGQVLVDYHPGGDAPLSFIKVWTSTKPGYRKLVCEYWPHSLWQHASRLTFANSYGSARLVQAFAAIARNPQAFPNLSDHDRDGFIRVQNPTPEEHDQAGQSFTAALLTSKNVPSVARGFVPGLRFSDAS